MPRSSEHAESRAVLPASVALHARPAGTLVRAACAFDASISVAANGKRANAKSILDVLKLGATGGTEVAFSASGLDAAAAVALLSELVAALR